MKAEIERRRAAAQSVPAAEEGAETAVQKAPEAEESPEVPEPEESPETAETPEPLQTTEAAAAAVQPEAEQPEASAQAAPDETAAPAAEQPERDAKAEKNDGPGGSRGHNAGTTEMTGQAVSEAAFTKDIGKCFVWRQPDECKRRMKNGGTDQR